MEFDRVSEWFEENWWWIALIAVIILFWGFLYKFCPRQEDPIVKAKSSVSREYEALKELITDWKEVCINNETESVTLSLSSIDELEYRLNNYVEAVTLLDSTRRVQIKQLEGAYMTQTSITK